MNIKEAKEEVKNTVRAYLAKDETGAYLIPTEKQRPLLLIGPPGIGKTAIMEQVAQEMDINLVSYTITHHTRQSAIGLPMIEHKSFGGQDYAVTEYTMSEIIASVYERIEESGISEGILFLDEINCVSETLAPTMLQFLQYKTFGGHKVPDGFVIVTAGNPPEYNKSVREFDIVTLDRVRRIDITANAEVWRTYARNAGVHGAILAYLAIHPNHFYSMRTDIEDRQFVTARGWEDLSRMIKAYEKLGIPVTEGIVAEYLQDAEISRDFATYYSLYQKYKDQYRIGDILAGHFPEDYETLAKAPFDEKLSLLGLLNDALSVRFSSYIESYEVEKCIFEDLKRIKGQLQAAQNEDVTSGQSAVQMKDELSEQSSVQGKIELLDQSAQQQTSIQSTDYVRTLVEEAIASEEEKARNTARTGTRNEEKLRIERLTITALKELSAQLLEKSAYSIAVAWFQNREIQRQEEIDETSRELTNALNFLAEVYGENQEMVLFLTDLSSSEDALAFLSDCGNDAYDRYSKLLLMQDRREALRDEARQILHLS